MRHFRVIRTVTCMPWCGDGGKIKVSASECFPSFLVSYLNKLSRNDRLRRQQNSMFRIIPQENKKGFMKRNILFLFWRQNGNKIYSC